MDSIFEIEGEDGQKYVGRAVNISETGINVVTHPPLKEGMKVSLLNILSSPFKFHGAGKVIWTHPNESATVSGISLLEIASEDKEKIKNYSAIFGRNPKKSSFLKIILGLGVPSVPFLSFFLLSKFPGHKNGTFFSIGITFLIIERLWETFFTSKEMKAFESSEDWTITAVSFYYITLYLTGITEFFFYPKDQILVSIIGIAILLISFLIRIWGMRTLGQQWAVHAIGNSQNTIKRKLITDGPYKFVRHPIYLAVILELLAIALFAQSYFAFALAILVNIPLQILRSRLEERRLLEQFGNDYLHYSQKTPALVPFPFHPR